ncbi:hypothetical protein BH10BAC1_BH10BAC1_11240 [soil metagenome]
MKIYTKRTILFLISIIGLTLMDSCKPKKLVNPYRAAKERPSDKERKEEAKLVKKGTKNYKKNVKDNKKRYEDEINKSFATKQKYKGTTKIKRRKRSKKVRWHL